MSDHVVVIDGIQLERAEALIPDEVEDLALFNAERRAGYLYDQGTLLRMAEMQRRFDWLGYFAEDGVHRGGRLASARGVVIRSQSKKWWQRKALA